MLLISFCVLTGEEIGFSNYDNPDYCWLKGDKIVEWFGIPAILVAIFNIALYISVLRFIVKSARYIMDSINCSIIFCNIPLSVLKDMLPCFQ